MEYRVNINGIDVEAGYSEENIEEIFSPLLKRLADMRRSKGERVLLMLAAPPGAGKSTLSSFLEYYAKELLPEMTVQAIGMDGFHRRQEYLLTHETEVDGRLIPMVQIKGAPITFDLKELTEKIRTVAEGKTCEWPSYDRHLHNPVENAIRVTGDIVILEGNYLLLDEEGWRDLHEMADYTIFIRAKEDCLRNRLIDRKEASGNSRKKAEEFVDFSDMRNVKVCLEHSLKPDLELCINDDGEFEVK